MQCETPSPFRQFANRSPRLTFIVRFICARSIIWLRVVGRWFKVDGLIVCICFAQFGSCMRECMMSLNMKIYAPATARIAAASETFFRSISAALSWALMCRVCVCVKRRISIGASILVFAGTMHDVVRVRTIPMFKANVNLFNGQGEGELFKHQNEPKAVHIHTRWYIRVWIKRANRKNSSSHLVIAILGFCGRYPEHRSTGRVAVSVFTELSKCDRSG